MKLVNTVDKAIVLYHAEKPDKLIAFLEGEGFSVLPLKNAWKEEYSGYSPSYLAFLAHMAAWKQALKYSRALICEYDFVPVEGFGAFPAPFDPEEEDFGICWLYTTGPRFYGLRPDGLIQGGSTSLVSYVVSSGTARALLDPAFKTLVPEVYTPWDSDIDGFLIGRGKINYIPLRNYGEHGGHLNREHMIKVKHSWGHRADVLAGPLAFMPGYAEGSRTRYFVIRIHAYLRGVARLFSGRLLRFKIFRRSSRRWELFRYAVSRFFSRIM